jgi:hypothetical protein
MRSARTSRCSALSGGNPRSRNTFPLERVTLRLGLLRHRTSSTRSDAPPRPAPEAKPGRMGLFTFRPRRGLVLRL